MRGRGYEATSEDRVTVSVLYMLLLLLFYKRNDNNDNNNRVIFCSRCDVSCLFHVFDIYIVVKLSSDLVSGRIHDALFVFFCVIPGIILRLPFSVLFLFHNILGFRSIS